MNNFKNVVNSNLLPNYILRCFYKNNYEISEYERKYLIQEFIDRLLLGEFTKEGKTNVDREYFSKLKIK